MTQQRFSLVLDQGSSNQMMVLNVRELLVFHAPFTWESGVMTVWPRNVQIINWEKRKPWLDLDLRF